MKKNKKVFMIAVTGILSALTLALSYIEKIVLAVYPLPLGIKPGLSNIIVMFTCESLGLIPAFSLVIIKAGFSLLLSGITSGFLSLAGGILSVLVIYFSRKISKNKLSFLGVSVLSAVFHNLGQLTGASLISGTNLFFGYAPILLVSAVLFGLVTGTVISFIMPALKKYDFLFKKSK